MILFVCKCVLPPGDNTIAVNKYTISYHTISYHIISYHIISYHIISYHNGILSTDFQKIRKCKISRKSVQWVPSCSARTDGRTDGWTEDTDMKKVVVAFAIIYHIISNHISYHIISYHIISYHIIPYHIISYHIIMEFYQQIFKKYSSVRSHESTCNGCRVVQRGRTDGWMDRGYRHDESSSNFRNFVKAPKTVHSITLQSGTYHAAD